MFKIDLGKNSNVFLDNHYNRLVENSFTLGSQKIKNESSLKKRIDNRIQLLKSSLTSDPLCEKFFQDLKKDNYKWLKIIIQGDPKQLSKVIANVKTRISKGVYPNIEYMKKGDPDKKFGDHIRYVFNYDAFITKPKISKSKVKAGIPYKYDAYKLAEAVNVNVCPYCNRGFTFTLTKGEERLVRPEFDHFFDKATYPYLALSFYNLIPSCHICNSGLKHDAAFTLGNNLHPYLEGLDDYLKFTVKLKDKKLLDGIRKKEIKDYISLFYGNLDGFSLDLIHRVGCERKNLRRANQTHKVFKTIDLFEMHKDLIVEMLQSALIYNESLIQEYIINFEGKLFRNREDILRFLNRNYMKKEDLSKRPFSKINQDIAVEFGIPY
ncbi:hypothetical protein I5M27_08660 [Adhaeribacter sp. BT258]|uniref:HNH endonuclease n=1 Tax=Adhaeribacter terrigena TaxID=2793070 RepID=A0ABS1C1L2_9BACT|nr:hypothetical protein [Adhaeribacter terrigena]MBK0403056.1 hypothetical protein [Adhaeribacter terrigena]